MGTLCTFPAFQAYTDFGLVNKILSAILLVRSLNFDGKMQNIFADTDMVEIHKKARNLEKVKLCTWVLQLKA